MTFLVVTVDSVEISDQLALERVRSSLDHIFPETVKLSCSLPKQHAGPPRACERCSQGFDGLMYDAATKGGPWGCICHTCFSAVGMGLGTGLGQKYCLVAGCWVKVAG